jgi:hypothetical protein
VALEIGVVADEDLAIGVWTHLVAATLVPERAAVTCRWDK